MNHTNVWVFWTSKLRSPPSIVLHVKLDDKLSMAAVWLTARAVRILTNLQHKAADTRSTNHELEASVNPGFFKSRRKVRGRVSLRSVHDNNNNCVNTKVAKRVSEVKWDYFSCLLWIKVNGGGSGILFIY